VIKLWAGRPRFDFHQGERRHFCLHHGVPTSSGYRPAFCSVGTRVFPMD